MLGDPGQLHQVILNLVTNAAQAIGAKPGRIQVGLVPVGDALCLNVADTGCGMDETTRTRMFEPFFTTKAVNEGTGLGLSVVHGIVTSHGGRIDVHSEPGEGSDITIWLPRHAGEDVAKREDATAAQ
ncbi:MAG TPA: ATP-binding protein [Stellaceae bacterium]|nr:ATP-binding protein [Stellaceae bacterium]